MHRPGVPVIRFCSGLREVAAIVVVRLVPVARRHHQRIITPVGADIGRHMIGDLESAGNRKGTALTEIPLDIIDDQGSSFRVHPARVRYVLSLLPPWKTGLPAVNHS